ncbi:hypothetical protein MYCTH_2312085 [Thermothelomyces thermophilus ATCC 42464]|uniref:Uncharacterized protein n=1 Tax=Thermothelomyces thermophilus (strain ATCC 42464 / BCRC 31852 / DSM 1799) TaxID=573729 RepID=G2QQ21_THET4|nr:uncharacterized protein MYCTH_2312085 [Thermothelomyces thermophilus ATCC 42464]AEO61684.1 hypothetical protein MYCTH_2312085 [Thermothelomyces thermophilus ATCC 42464]
MAAKGTISRPAPPGRLPTSGSTSSGRALGSGYETPMGVEGMPWPDTPLSAPATAAVPGGSGGLAATTAGGLRRARTDLGGGAVSGGPGPASLSARLQGLATGSGAGNGPSLRGVHSPAESLNGVVTRARGTGRKVGWRDRVACFQWTWFTMTMVRPSLAFFFTFFLAFGWGDRGARRRERKKKLV